MVRAFADVSAGMVFVLSDEELVVWRTLEQAFNTATAAIIKTKRRSNEWFIIGRAEKEGENLSCLGSCAYKRNNLCGATPINGITRATVSVVMYDGAVIG